MRRAFALSAAILLTGLIIGCQEEGPTAIDNSGESEPTALAKGGHAATYEVKLENLTPATGDGSSQPLSPPVLATHKRNLHLFRVRRFATEAMQKIAEDAENGPMVEFLQNSSKVHEVVEGGGVILPGGEATFTITGRSSRSRLSLVSMLVNTNDGFAGADGVRLPRKENRSKVYYLWAYDAGTEENTESLSHIPGPCCNSPGVRVPTHQKIRHHRGIKGIGDLDRDVYGWHGSVAKLTITRID